MNISFSIDGKPAGDVNPELAREFEERAREGRVVYCDTCNHELDEFDRGYTCRGCLASPEARRDRGEGGREQ